MTEALCSVWRSLVANPRDDEVVARARERLDELLDHLDECDVCAEVSEQGVGAKDADGDGVGNGDGGMDADMDLVAIYQALGVTDELEEPESDLADKILQIKADDDARITEAVQDVLLPNLPHATQLGYEDMKGDVSPRQLFLAIDAVALLLERYDWPDGPTHFELSGDGDVFVDGSVAIPRTTVVNEIARMSAVSDKAAESLARWIPLAAQSQKNLLLGATAKVLKGDRIGITMEERDNSRDLAEYWGLDAAPIPIEPVAPQPVADGIEAPEIDGVGGGGYGEFVPPVIPPASEPGVAIGYRKGSILQAGGEARSAEEVVAGIMAAELEEPIVDEAAAAPMAVSGGPAADSDLEAMALDEVEFFGEAIAEAEAEPEAEVGAGAEAEAEAAPSEEWPEDREP